MTLAETQHTMQKLIIVAIVGTILFYIARFGIGVAQQAYYALNPPKKPEPLANFGMLPQLKMTSKAITGVPKYNLETPNRTLPKFNDRANVYKFIEPKSSFVSEDQIKDITKKLAFTTDPIRTNPAERIWNDGIGKRVFQANVVNKNFTMTTSLSKISTIIGQSSTITTADATQTFSNFIKSTGIMQPLDIDNTQFETILTDVRVNRFVQDKISNDKAKIVKVNAYRNLQEGNNIYRIYSNNPNDSLINGYITNAKSPENIVQINVTYWPVDYTVRSEYYLSPINQVWDAIAQNKGVIADIKAKSDDYYDFNTTYEVETIDILDVTMGYYEPKDFTQYLQPIYIFKGVFKTKPTPGQLSKDGQITIYFPAIRGDYVTQTTQQTN